MKLENVLNFYIGCKVEFGFDGRKNIGKLIGKVEPFGYQIDPKGSTIFAPMINVRVGLIKPILRKLSSMTEEEAIHLIGILFSDPSIDKIDADEIQIDLVQNDDGLMVDADMALVIDVSCRCFEGQIAIRECGSIMLWDDDGKMQRLANVPQAFVYMLSLGMDLFQLIESISAIESSELNKEKTK